LIIKYQNLNAILRKQKNFIINEKTFRDRGLNSDSIPNRDNLNLNLIKLI